MSKRRILAALILGTAIALILVFLFLKPGFNRFPREKITIGMEPTGYSLLIAVAREKGFFRKQNLDIEFKEYISGLAALEGQLRGESDVATISEIAFALKCFEIKDRKIIGSIARGMHVIKVIARRDRGITEPADLKGKKVAVALRTSNGYLLSSFLTHNRVSWEDVTIVETPPARWIDSIVNGDVDAAVVWIRFVDEILRHLGKNAVIWDPPMNHEFHWFLVGGKEWLGARPKRVEHLLRSLVDAEEYIRNDPAGARQLFTKHFPEEIHYEKLRYFVSLDQTLLPVMEDVARWNVNKGLARQREVPNYLNMVYTKGLEAVKPETVTIFR